MALNSRHLRNGLLQQAWDEWLTAYHPVVKEDIEMMKAEKESILILFN